MLGLSLCVRACLALRKLEEAHHFLKEALANPRSQPGAWHATILVYATLKFHQEKRWVEAVEAISAYGSQVSPDIPANLQAIQAQLEAELATAVYQAAQERGQSLDLDAFAQNILFEKVLM